MRTLPIFYPVTWWVQESSLSLIEALTLEYIYVIVYEDLFKYDFIHLWSAGIAFIKYEHILYVEKCDDSAIQTDLLDAD